jgi:hypothetical protein
MVLDQPRRRPIKRIHVPMNYVHADGKDYLVVADTRSRAWSNSSRRTASSRCRRSRSSSRATSIRGDRLEVSQVDSERVAKLVIDGKIDGTSTRPATTCTYSCAATRAHA